MEWPADSPVHRRLVLVVARVTESTRAAARHGDEAFFEALQDYGDLANGIVEEAGGRLIKLMGDGVLAVFPGDAGPSAVGACERLQSAGTDLWQRFDQKCQVQVKATSGSVVMGTINGRPDVAGRDLNMLMQAPWTGDIVIDPSVRGAP